jgi:hypothetical protein
MTVAQLIFVKLALDPKFLTTTKFRENPTNGLVADTRSQTRTDGRTNVVFTYNVFFLTS